MERLIGEGWELGVFRSDQCLTICIPIEISFVTLSYEFECSSEDLLVLQQDRFRRKVLEFILYEYLQRKSLRGSSPIETPQVLHIIRTVLHGSMPDVEREISMSLDPGYIRFRMSKEGL